MAKGDIIRAQNPAPEIEYFPIIATNPPVAGDPVYLNAGTITRATNTSVGPHKVLTHLEKEQNSARGIMISGQIEMVAAGAIQPGSYVISNATGGVITRGSASFDKVIGIYLKRVSDEKGAPTAAANNVPIIVRVTAF